MLLNSDLLLVISDPWELASSVGTSSVRAVVAATDEDVDRGGLVLAVGEPLNYDGATYGLLVALARGHENLADSLLRDGRAEANLYGVGGEVTPTDPFGLGWWRGGLGAIGTIALPPATFA